MADNTTIRNQDINITSDTSLNVYKEDLRVSGNGLTVASATLTLEVIVLQVDIIYSFELVRNEGVEKFTVDRQISDGSWIPLNPYQTVS